MGVSVFGRILPLLLDELLHLLVTVLNALRLGTARILISLICRICEHDLVPIGLRLLLSERLGPKILLDGENWTTVLVSTIRDADVLTVILVGVLTYAISGSWPVATLRLSGVVHDPYVVAGLGFNHRLHGLLLLIKNVPNILR